MRLTDSWLRSVKPRRERYDVTVDGRPGLMARVHPSGAVSFRFRYQRSGQRLSMVLGEFGEGGLSLADAYERHHEAQRELAKDLDPIEERDRRRAETEIFRRARAEAGTVAQVVEQFVHRKLRAERWDAASGGWSRDPKAKTKARKRPDDAAALLGCGEGRNGDNDRKRAPTIVSELGSEKAHDLTRRQLIEFLDRIVDRGAPITANRVHALLKQLFDWAAAKDIIPASPMAGIERPGGEERPRNRVLTTHDIKCFWSKLDDADMAMPTRLALKLLLVTAQRRGELTFAKWDHFDLDAKRWTIPVELLKSSHSRKATPEPHIVPLSELAIEILEELKAITGTATHLLPAHADQKKHGSYSERVLSRAVRKNAQHFGISHFTPHDLRRTAASFMTKLGTPRLHVEKLLNHSTGDVAEIYDRHDYLAEKRAALERWGEHLTALVEGKSPSVVQFQKTA